MDVDVSGASVSDSEGCGNGTPSGHMASHTGGPTKLKRSSSAPMINQLVNQPQACLVSAPTSTSITRDVVLSAEVVPGAQPRVRRFSASFGPVSPLSPGSSRTNSSGPLRVCQLRVEEGMDVVNREAALERTVQSTLQLSDTLSQSWEDLILTEDVVRPKLHSNSVSGGGSNSSTPSTNMTHGGVAPIAARERGDLHTRRDYTDPLHLTIVPTVAVPLTGCGASPTRGGVGRQCFSPSLQQTVRNTSFCHSPSPTKKSFTTRRSLSPIALRPSPLGAGLKRKWEMDERCEPFLTPSKRASTCAPDRCVGGLLITQPHSVGSLGDSTPSPAGPGSLGSVGTPDSVCSSGGSPILSAPPYSPSASIAETPVAPTTPDPTPPHLFKPVSPAAAAAALNTDHTAPADHRFGNQEQHHAERFGLSTDHAAAAAAASDHRFGSQQQQQQHQHTAERFGISTDHAVDPRFGSQGDHHHSAAGRFVGRDHHHNDHFSNRDHSEQFGGRETRDHFGGQEHTNQFRGRQEHGGSQEHRNQFGRQGHHQDQYSSHQGKGGAADTSDGSSSSDAMITEDVPTTNDLKSYQDMELSDSLAQPPLNNI